MFHNTFDPCFVPPKSKNSVNREGVVAVDILFYEDDGLLRSLHNDEGLKSITDYLITLGASPNALVGLVYNFHHYLVYLSYNT